MIKSKWLERRWRGILVVLIVASLPVWVRLTHRDEVVGRDRPIVLDDFVFKVQDVRVVDGSGPGDGPRSDRDQSMIVSLRITNRARRVSFAFDPGWAVVVDGRGDERRISPALQRKQDGRDMARSPYRAPIKAGEAAEVDLVFEYPPDAGPFQFRISSGGMIGDFLDGFLSGPRRIALDR